MATGLPQPVPVTEGGTGSKTSVGARQALGIAGLTAVDGSSTNGIEFQLSSLSTIVALQPPDVDGLIGVVVTKDTTGDPVVQEGVFVINTVDNNFKVMADGAMRSLATW